RQRRSPLAGWRRGRRAFRKDPRPRLIPNICGESVRHGRAPPIFRLERPNALGNVARRLRPVVWTFLKEMPHEPGYIVGQLGYNSCEPGRLVVMNRFNERNGGLTVKGQVPSDHLMEHNTQ